MAFISLDIICSYNHPNYLVKRSNILCNLVFKMPYNNYMNYKHFEKVKVDEEPDNCKKMEEYKKIDS